ncbi:MAG TPA: hypothetical protein VKX28_08305 [Xanthobacteraceae bacterium]|jgi:hypothetical protein|nr:hypothetical protein [Xanthobacteraceae bacterium]
MIAARSVARTLALVATITATIGPAAGQGPRKLHFRVLNTLVDVAAALETCWLANEPPLAQSRPGMNVTVMLNFTRTGEIFGEPRFTYITREATPETKALYQRAVVAALDACTPLPFSPALGNALAGIPKVMPFIDRRNEKGI